MKGYIVFLLDNLLVESESRAYFRNEYFENGPYRRGMNQHEDPVVNEEFLDSNSIKENMENFYPVEKKTNFVVNCLTAYQKNCYHAFRLAGNSQQASFNSCCL
ncbi:uncharacterized protein LOC136081042 [Hydra vulgaris]|uniref:Uncharacterized protein LOC136081042 n=1 Tax=Hydra vulgaris TaxID=6087 RepID=A0ABM4BYX9_HYDVU